MMDIVCLRACSSKMERKMDFKSTQVRVNLKTKISYLLLKMRIVIETSAVL